MHPAAGLHRPRTRNSARPSAPTEPPRRRAKPGREVRRGTKPEAPTGGTVGTLGGASRPPNSSGLRGARSGLHVGRAPEFGSSGGLHVGRAPEFGSSGGAACAPTVLAARPTVRSQAGGGSPAWVSSYSVLGFNWGWGDGPGGGTTSVTTGGIHGASCRRLRVPPRPFPLLIPATSLSLPLPFTRKGAENQKGGPAEKSGVRTKT